MNLYQIKHGAYSRIIEAKSALEAINVWVNHINRTEYYDRKTSFNPSSFSVEELDRVKAIVKASE